AKSHPAEYLQLVVELSLKNDPNFLAISLIFSHPFWLALTPISTVSTQPRRQRWDFQPPQQHWDIQPPQQRRDFQPPRQRRDFQQPRQHQDYSPLWVLLLILIAAVLWVEMNQKQHFWRGLERFSEAAGKQLDKKPIPDIERWRLQRIETIETLQELEKKLEIVCFYSSCGEVAGSGNSLTPGAMGFTGEPFSQSAESVMYPTGCLTEEASSIMELILSAKYQNDLQAVLLKDKQVSLSLDGWLKFSPNLEMEFQKIFDYDLKSQNSMKFKSYNAFFNFLTHFKNFERTIEYMKSSEYSSLLKESDEINELREFSRRVLDSPSFSNKIRYSLFVLNILIGANNYVISLTKDYRDVRVENIVSAMLFLQNNLDMKFSFKVKPSDLILLNVLDLAKDITSDIDGTKIFKDRRCPYSDSLAHVIYMLQQELNMIESSFPII
ncbi:unnamed protein product, partial [Larinioides sclopetarius]